MILAYFPYQSYRDIMDWVGTFWNTPKTIRKSESKERRWNERDGKTKPFEKHAYRTYVLKNLDSLTKMKIKVRDWVEDYEKENNIIQKWTRVLVTSKTWKTNLHLNRNTIEPHFPKCLISLWCLSLWFSQTRCLHSHTHLTLAASELRAKGE